MECKIKNTHKRLLESHRLWHQALDNYFDPEAFRVNLNATIQALRNLTFALQNEKCVFDDFDIWYSKWQNNMKKDSILKWLNSARVEIVHKKDIERISIARVTIFGYLDIFKADIKLPIDIPKSMIAQYLFDYKYINEVMITQDYVLKVERRWIVTEIPDYEILDALAYCYGFMYNLVKDAHEIIETSINKCTIHDTLHREQKVLYNDLGIPNCMELSNSLRTKNLSLKSLDSKEFKEYVVEYNDEIMKKVIKKYKVNKELLNFGAKKQDIREFAISTLDIAKIVLSKDGYHTPIFFLMNEDDDMKLHQLKIPENKSDKFIMMQYIAEKVKLYKSDGVVFLFESWITPDIESYMKGIPTEEHSEKIECLITYVATKKGLKTSFISTFTRNRFGKIKFEETIEIKLEGEGVLSPIYKVWSER